MSVDAIAVINLKSVSAIGGWESLLVSRTDPPIDFAQWAACAGQPQRLSLGLGASGSRNCIITVATGYPADLLKPLVLSLRKYTDAHLIIVANESNDLEQAFAEYDVSIYPVKKTVGYRPYPALARIQYYLEILASLPANVDRLLLVDSRDIIFQADPFKALPVAELSFFSENKSESYTSSRLNPEMVPPLFSKSKYTMVGKNKPKGILSNSVLISIT